MYLTATIKLQHNSALGCMYLTATIRLQHNSALVCMYLTATIRLQHNSALGCMYLTATIRLQDESLWLALLRALQVLPQSLEVFWQHICLGTELIMSREQCCHGCDAACKRLLATQLQHASEMVDLLQECIQDVRFVTHRNVSVKI